MEAISAAHYLRIEFESSVWRLISTELDSPTTLLEATPEGLITHPVFRAARSLPNSTLSPAQIVRVMLGYAPESQAWRLGMLLIDNSATKLDTTQMQWCELAAWPDESFTIQVDNARLAGQALARLINRPFQFVESNAASRVRVFSRQSTPVDLAESPASPAATIAALAVETPAHEDLEESAAIAEPSVEAPIIPDIHPLSLPLQFMGWRLTRISSGIRWRRMRGWWVVNLIRLTGLAILSVLFLVLGIGSKTRGLAEVEPERLPDAGLLIGVVLLLSLMVAIWRLLRENATFVDTLNREVYAQGLVLPFVHWRVPFDKIEYVLITQSSPRAQGRRRRTDPMRIAQEVWLHVFDGNDFYEMVDLETVEGQSWVWDTVRTHSHSQVRRGLQLAHYDTPAHHAAQQIAEMINVPVYLDLI